MKNVTNSKRHWFHHLLAGILICVLAGVTYFHIYHLWFVSKKVPDQLRACNENSDCTLTRRFSCAACAPCSYNGIDPGVVAVNPEERRTFCDEKSKGPSMVLKNTGCAAGCQYKESTDFPYAATCVQNTCKKVFFFDPRRAF